ncbi:MAG TPA: hypothetical protein ENH12_06200, partial [Proteobacteria bacterium]|nr:hypothetical protein [Pseudomonadota bacterium]
VMYTAILTTLFVVGCDVAGLYFVASRRFSIPEGITNVLIYGGLGSVAAMLVGFGVLHSGLPFLDKASPASFRLALILIPVNLFSLIFLNLLTAARRFPQYMLVSVVQGVSQLIFVFFFVRIQGGGVNGALFGILAAGIVTITFTLVLFYREDGAVFKTPNISQLKEMLHYGARYYVAKISNMANVQVGTLILALFATREEIAFFAVAIRVTIQVMIVPDTLTLVLIPRSARDREGKKELVARSARLTGLVCGAALILLVIFTRPLVVILFSPAFAPAIPLIRIISIGVLIRSASKVIVPYLIGTDHPGIASISVGVGMLVNLGMLLLLLPLIGLSGAAVAVTAGYLAGAVVILFWFSRLSGLGVGEIMIPRRSDIFYMISLLKRGKRGVPTS